MPIEVFGRGFNWRSKISGAGVATSCTGCYAMAMAGSKTKDIDTYLASAGPEQRRLLAELRQTIRRILPQAEECISYGIPAFRVDGGIVAGFAVTKTGGSYYPFSGRTLADLAGELGDRGRTKSALHFTAERPLPVGLVRKLLKARLAEISAKQD
jgi:uncharacterized protein YdhG (YjbR/CyaY superfamily)